MATHLGSKGGYVDQRTQESHVHTSDGDRMSVEAMTVVLHHSAASGTDKLVLLGIANHDGDGGAWPAVATLAKYANVSERSVQRSLTALVERGEVRVIYRDGGTRSTREDRRPNRYEILVCCPESCDRTTQHKTRGDASVTPSSQGSRGDAGNARGDVLVSSGVTPTSPEPSYEPPRNHPSPADFSTSSSPKVTRATADDWVSADSPVGGGPVVPQAAPGGEMSAEDLREIVCAVISIRPEWQTPGIQAQLRQVAHLPYAEVRQAFEEAAGDRSIYTPMHLATAAQARMAAQVERERAVGHRERAAEDWRREVHKDVTNRARPESRAEYLARLKAEAQAGKLRSPVRTENRSA